MGRRCIKVVSDKLDRGSAREHCRHDNTDLITLESQAKTDEFRDFMEENGHASVNYWCGASRVTDGWQWVNGVPISSNSWCRYEGNGTRCGATINPPSTCLDYRSCSRTMSFVCELQF
ncbi:uncharacterized protein LOC125380928 [Haliotis rufescens]|uniref:uncharacterized protein LOC125380928 n=1 Tax=Haliotis rufescens TaxID=6454 RepID=UPI00201EB4E1|nr:uncharacterized protein LOC125380928 [Haliotis rufescens]